MSTWFAKTAVLLRQWPSATFDGMDTAARRVIAGVEQHEAAGDHRTRTVDRPAARRDAVDRVVRPHCVEIPQDRAVARRIRAHVAVDGPGEGDAGNRRDRRRLRGAAAGTIAAACWRRVPDALAGVE